MSKGLTVGELEQVLAGGCQEPGCTHDHTTLVLAPRCCRRGVTLDARLVEGAVLLSLSCATCGREVAGIRLLESYAPQLAEWAFELSEHAECCLVTDGLPESCGLPPIPLDVSYTKGSAEIKVACRQCDDLLFTWTVSMV